MAPRRTWPHGRSRGRRGRRELEVPALLLLLLLTTSIYNDNSAVVDIAVDGALAPSAGVGVGRGGNVLKYGPLIVTVSTSVGQSVVIASSLPKMPFRHRRGGNENPQSA